MKLFFGSTEQFHTAWIRFTMPFLSFLSTKDRFFITRVGTTLWRRPSSFRSSPLA